VSLSAIQADRVFKKSILAFIWFESSIRLSGFRLPASASPRQAGRRVNRKNAILLKNNAGKNIL